MFLNINLYMLIKKHLLHLTILCLFKILSFIHITHLYSLIKKSISFILFLLFHAINCRHNIVHLYLYLSILYRSLFRTYHYHHLTRFLTLQKIGFQSMKCQNF